MLRASFTPYTLHFGFEAVTSRERMRSKSTYFVSVWDDEHPTVVGTGECALFRGLSADDREDYENVLSDICIRINTVKIADLTEWPSIVFGIETALADLRNGGRMMPFPSDWTDGGSGLHINGLVWMGSVEEMTRRAEEKISEGFRCVKLKIGGCDFERELHLLEQLRRRFAPEELEIRLDANGAFDVDEALQKLRRLATLDIHSIEQPIASRQWDAMKSLCNVSPIDIALDEELIGVFSVDEKRRMIEYLRPAYIILKPALCGGFSGSSEWIEAAENVGIRWWVTSALESNIGLNALAQWVASMKCDMPSGLGTGQLYTNNFRSPVERRGAMLYYNPAIEAERPEIISNSRYTPSFSSKNHSNKSQNITRS